MNRLYSSKELSILLALKPATIRRKARLSLGLREHVVGGGTLRYEVVDESLRTTLERLQASEAPQQVEAEAIPIPEPENALMAVSAAPVASFEPLPDLTDAEYAASKAYWYGSRRAGAPRATCEAVDDGEPCTEPAEARGLCHKHYRRWRYHNRKRKVTLAGGER